MTLVHLRECGHGAHISHCKLERGVLAAKRRPACLIMMPGAWVARAAEFSAWGEIWHHRQPFQRSPKAEWSLNFVVFPFLHASTCLSFMADGASYKAHSGGLAARRPMLSTN